ncbi:ABC transporter ATP-binding protein [Parahaliea mediterranea]|uniref:ABC transporter ATP-binding protein n=1 Tax=Parahaliea mediterranea TaxID=651086 RepID=A0A939DDQ8_9GAMM|nr:ABC transporter ATP-binding protein [Parahaliea mediterranea]MBN7796164.1 ABC transporter ATP-binding protein [Parahaliea mediterranea]
MSQVIEARDLSRRFDQVQAVDKVDLSLSAGSVLGLIGPNGAGKTTLLRALLGLTDCDGEVSVLGIDPRRDHARLMQQVCFIADTAVLPRWMTVRQLLDYVSGIHPRFQRRQAEQFLATTEVGAKRKVRELSKGMTVQLHLALVMAVDAKVLILDEPTLGLDLLFRKRFYEQLLNDYFDDERTIIISTHQVEEVQHILTEVVFMDRGRLIMHKPMSSFDEEFAELHVVGEATARAEAIPHIGSRTILGGKAILYEGVDRSLLESLGEVRTPSVSDLFVAKIEGAQNHV